MTPRLVFVYGTLKRPYGNSRLLETSSSLVGEAVTVEKFLLVNCGFPYMIPEHMLTGPRRALTARVAGQVWEVQDEATMASLDRLEGVGYGHYKHQVVQVCVEGQFWASAQAYVPCDDDVQDLPMCEKIQWGDEEVFQWSR